MTKLLAKWLIAAGSIVLVAYIFTEITLTDFVTALIVALVLGLFSVTLKPILKILTLPINIITLGLFGFVINAALLLLAAELVDGFAVTGFQTAFLAALIVLVINRITGSIIKGV